MAFNERAGFGDHVIVTGARIEGQAVRLATIGDALIFFPTPAVLLFGAIF